MGPKYSVLVPTRNRVEYLRFSLESIPLAGRNDVEVIVSDNSDLHVAGAVRDLVSTKGPPFRYVRPPAVPVPMSENWEFALFSAKGDYTLLIGDDDALLPSAFRVLDNLFDANPGRIVRWPMIAYFWPDFVKPEMRDRMKLPLAQRSDRGLIDRLDGHRMLHDVLRGARRYFELPMLYNSAIPRDVIEKSFSGTPPRFPSASPDVYSAMSFAYFARSFDSLGFPLSINGQGAKGNGAAFLFRDKSSNVAADFEALNTSTGRPNYPSGVPPVPTVTFATMETFVRFAERHPEVRPSFPLEEMTLALRAAHELNSLPITKAEYGASYRELIARFPALATKLERLSQKGPATTIDWYTPGYRPGTLTIAPSAFGVFDVAGAAALAEQIMGPPPEFFSFRAAGREPLVDRLKERARDWLPPAAYRALARAKNGHA